MFILLVSLAPTHLAVATAAPDLRRRPHNINESLHNVLEDLEASLLHEAISDESFRMPVSDILHITVYTVMIYIGTTTVYITI